MRQEAHLREESWFKGEWADLAIYAILLKEWRPLNRLTTELVSPLAGPNERGE